MSIFFRFQLKVIIVGPLNVFMITDRGSILIFDVLTIDVCKKLFAASITRHIEVKTGLVALRFVETVEKLILPNNNNICYFFGFVELNSLLK